jgi:hypothetical protein
VTSAGLRPATTRAAIVSDQTGRRVGRVDGIRRAGWAGR